MKKLGFITMIAATVFTFQACNNEPKDSKEMADSLNKAKDSTNNVANTGGIAAPEEDAKFSTTAAMGGMAEVEFAKIALAKSTNAKIKEFANMMVTDHGKANEELMTIATSKNITLPGALDEDHLKMQNDLNAKTGVDFDKKYVDMMVDGHQKTLDLMEKEAKDGMDADLKAFATKTAPVVKGHLDMIKAIKDGLK